MQVEPGGSGGSLGNLGASLNLYSCTDSFTVANERGELGVGGQPGGQVGRGLEVEQGHSCGEGFAYGQGFQLIHWYGLDLGGGGVSKGGRSGV
ncbi:MAG: hypothetical protein ACI90Z_002283 [Cyanobium sp.]